MRMPTPPAEPPVHALSRLRLRLAMVVTAAALLASCNGGGGGSDGDGLLGSPDPVPPPAAPSGTIYAFGGTGSPAQDGAEPKGSLTAVPTVGGGVVLYGRTAIGGSNGCGTIFSINPDGSNYQVLYRFAGPDGCDPRHDAMTRNPNDGRLYATTQGVNQTDNKTYGNQGQIFSFTPGVPIGTPINAVYTFAGQPLGAQQHSSFSIDPVTGMLYGMTAQGGDHDGGMLYAVSPDGATFVTLHSFKKSEGTNPHGRIVLVDGVLYGILRSDGTTSDGKSGHGAVFSFKVTSPLAEGPITILHTFAGGTTDSGLSDHGYLTPVTVGGKTILFGLTQCGGAGTGKDTCGSSDGGGGGTLFQIDPTAAPGSSAAYNLVYSFQGQDHGDGAGPYGSLMFDGTYLYGTTSGGGKHGMGTVFRVAPVAMGGTATPTVLQHFGSSSNDGQKPIDNVIRVGNTLYGMTVYGGASGKSPDSSSYTGNGAIFAIPLPD